MKPYNFYLDELIIRSLYIFSSYCVCLIIFFTNIETVFLFEFYPFALLFLKRFIVTRITDFVNVVWYLSLFFSSLFVFPFSWYHLYSFFSSSWYEYQIKLFNYLINSFFLIFIMVYFLLHNFALTFIFQFFFQWEVVSEVSLLRIESEVAILPYTGWSLNFKILLSVTISWLLFFSHLIFFFFHLKYLYNLIKYGKNIMFFFSIFSIFLIIPPDIIIQLFIIFITFTFFDFSFFFLCLKFYKTKINNANGSSIIKNTT